jgi:hypothetical protein
MNKKIMTLRLTAVTLLTVSTGAFGQIITTYAGTGVGGFSGDSGPASQAQVNNVTGLATDANGNLYLADQNNNRVRKVSPNGIITTFAGNGTAGFTGDSGAAIQAELNVPIGVCVAPSGAVYVNDLANHRVRMISTSGTITTVAGSGSAVSGGDGGPATSAGMNIPIRCAVDPSGNLYIADQGAHKIRKVDTGGTITTFAGTGTQGFSGDGGLATAATMNNPTWVMADPAGNIYVSDQFNQRVRMINTSGVITTIAGNGTAGFAGDGGPATSASLNFPGGLALDSAGSLFIVDPANNRVRKVSGGIITTVAGNGLPGSSGDGGAPLQAEFNNPFALALDATGNLYVGDIANNRVRKISGVAAGGGSSTSQSYYFSDLVFAGGFQTTLTYINYSPQAVTCVTNFFSDGGTALSIPFSQGTVTTRTDVIPPGGSVHDATIASLNAAVTQGWAQASCTGPVEAGLLYRLFSSGTAIGESSVNAETAPTTEFATFAQATAANSTGIAYANPSTSQSATITLTAYNTAGSLLGSHIVTLGPLAHGASNVGSWLGQTTFNGFVAITSTSPIISLSLNAEAFPVFSSLPPGDLPSTTRLVGSAPGPVSPQSYYFSDLAFAGGFQTTLTYINYSPVSITCVTNFFGDSGAPLSIPFAQGTISTRTDVIPPGGSVHDPTTASLNATVAEGWAQASCTGPVEAGLLYRLYSSGTPVGEASVNAETSPTTEFATFAQAAANSTGIAYANPSTTQSATITFEAYTQAGALTGSHIVTLGPLAHGASNVGSWVGQADFVGFVKVTSTLPIASLSLNAEAYPVFSSLPPGDLPSSTVMVP